MTLKHWNLILLGLTAWTVVFIMWATSPYDCQPPDRHGNVHCKR